MSKLVQINPTHKGPQYWRSLGELYNKPEFREWVDGEFAGGAAETLDRGSRRTVLKLMAASFGLAGLTACRRPEDRILPLSRGVEGFLPGKPEYYASQVTLSGVSHGVLVETHDGRPTKIEGNDKHPRSNGAATALVQASVLSMYDPDRSKEVLERGKASSWKAFFDGGKSLSLGAGEGLAILTETSNSPSMAATRRMIAAKFPKARFVEYDPVNYANAAAGAALAFGAGVEAHPQFDKAKVILSLDYDFLGIDAPDTVPTRQFANGRRITEHAEAMNRLYIVEAQFSLTGAMADHRLRSRVADVKSVAIDIGRALGVLPEGLNVVGGGDKKSKFLNALVKDLKANPGAALVVAGPRQPALVHAIAHLINSSLGAPVVYTRSGASAADPVAALAELVKEMNAGAVSCLVIAGGNPVFTAPADLRFGDALARVKTSIHLGLEVDETAKAATWHVPQAHALECWGDGRAVDGTVAIQQPMIEPLYGGKSPIELLEILFSGKAPAAVKGSEIVQNYWMSVLTGDKDSAWRTALHDGVVAGSGHAEVKPGIDAAKIKAAVQAESKAVGSGWEVSFYPSAACYDGRYANNGWMQECPDPMTKIIWGNAALISPKSAKDKGIEDNDVVKISAGGGSITIPVRIQPGMADNSIWLNLGYGRKAVGRVGQSVGVNTYPVRSSAGFWFSENASIDKTGEKATVATTQEWHRMEEPKLPIIEPFKRPLVREATLEEYKKNPKTIEEQGVEHPPLESLYGEWKYDKGFQWGMAIDLNACTGCNACIIACQAENNIPIVGKSEVMRGREMHWIRLDRYYTGDENDPQAVTQPVNCQQCENAPCENVCPVAATVHSPEGLNDMAYNRCVGTRYCANNCPYKVRRFNFLNYHINMTEVEKLQTNPDVSVRMRGVMEKCTYCTQRITEWKIQAKADARRSGKPVELKDGDIQTACQQTCPADAIAFGNILDPESRVAKMKKQERNYAMLAELNVKPRTTYLAKLRNPNPELA